MRAWYLKKEWVDREDDIEAVHIHYTLTLPEQAPDWQRDDKRWPMLAGSRLLKGLPVLAANGLPADGLSANSLSANRWPATEQDVPLRQHVLKLPLQVWDARREEWIGHYLLHYYYEVFQSGRHWSTEVFTDEIVYRDLEYVDWEGRLSGVSIYWSVSDWDAPVWMPTEDPRFLETFREGHERCSARLYRFADKPRFAMEKWNLMKQLPLPWRWTGRIYAPKGAVVRQRWHTGNLSPGMNWEDWDPHSPGDFVHFL